MTTNSVDFQTVRYLITLSYLFFRSYLILSISRRCLSAYLATFIFKTRGSESLVSFVRLIRELSVNLLLCFESLPN